MIVFLKSIDNKSYIFSRFISVLIRPFILFVSLYFELNELGTLLAMVFLVSSVNMMISSIPIFRDYFINYHNRSKLKKKYYRNKYKTEIVTVFLFSVILIFPINQFFDNNFQITFCSILIFSIDKIYDEIQRIFILNKKFYSWSILTNYKNFTLIIFFLNPIMNINIIYLGIIYFALNFYKQFKFINLSLIFGIKKSLKRFGISIWKNKKISIMTYLLFIDNIGDKIIVGKVFKESLTEYIFLSNILSIPSLGIFYFYISRYKIEFVKNLMDFTKIILSKKFNYLIISTFALVFIIILTYYNLEFSNFSILTILLLILLYISKCYILLLNEVIYWKKFYKDFLLFEVISLSIFIIIFVFSITFKLTIDLFILNLSIFYVSKFLFKFFVFTKKNEKSKNYLE
jgi:hypothetical protein